MSNVHLLFSRKLLRLKATLWCHAVDKSRTWATAEGSAGVMMVLWLVKEGRGNGEGFGQTADVHTYTKCN